MPTSRFALEPGGQPRLELTWRGIFKQMQVAVDGRLLGTIPDRAALERGATFSLAEGDTLLVRYDKTFGAQGIVVSRNGVPLAGSADDPATRVKTAVGLLYFIAGLNVLLGAITALAGVTVLQNIGIGWANVGEGVIYAVLGYLTWRRHTWALITAMVLFALDGVLSVVAAAAAGQTPTAGLVMRVFLILGMVRGIPALRTLNAKPATAPSFPMA